MTGSRVYAKSPTQMMTLRSRLQDKLESGELRALKFGIPEVDRVVRTMWAGRLTTVVARPGMGKTSVLIHMARQECQRILAVGSERSEYVLFVTLEESEEEVNMSVTKAPASVADMLEGAYDPAALRKHTLEETTKWPLFTVGYERMPLEAMELDDLPRLTVEQVCREVAGIEEKFSLRPASVFVDYLQIMDTDERGLSRHLGVAYALRELKKIGQLAECPVVLAVQAKERVDDRSPPVPQPSDSYYSSEVHHASDVMLSLWWPHNSPPHVYENGITYQGRSVDVTEQVFWLQLLKQRKAKPRDHWLIHVDMEHKTFGPLEAVHDAR